MGYTLIPLVAAPVLAIVYVFLTEASRASKVVVAVIVGLSLALWNFGQWPLVALVLQAAASIYVLVYLRIMKG